MLGGPILEIGPIETGQRHPNLSAYLPTVYLGTPFVSGVPASSSQCVEGFDSASFVMGCSSNIFGEAIETAGSTLAADPAVIGALSPVPDQVVDTGRVPSPFQGLNPGVYAESAQTEIVRRCWESLLRRDENLIDGGFIGRSREHSALVLTSRRECATDPGLVARTSHRRNHRGTLEICASLV